MRELARALGLCELLGERGLEEVPFSTVRALPFICPRGARTLSGAPTGGPGDMLSYNVHLGLKCSDPEIFRVGLRVNLLTRHGLQLSCWSRV